MVIDFSRNLESLHIFHRYPMDNIYSKKNLTREKQFKQDKKKVGFGGERKEGGSFQSKCECGSHSHTSLQVSG